MTESEIETPAKPAPRRTPKEVSAELETARLSLVANVDALQEYVKPANVLDRGVGRFQRIYFSDDGAPNVRNLAITFGVIAIYVLYRVRR